MTTLSKINKRLKRLNIDAELLPGKGYVYFSGPATISWHTTTVPGVVNVNNLTNEQGCDLFTEMSQLNAMGAR